MFKRYGPKNNSEIVRDAVGYTKSRTSCYDLRDSESPAARKLKTLEPLSRLHERTTVIATAEHKRYTALSSRWMLLAGNVTKIRTLP
jgi:hypothetical protein